MPSWDQLLALVNTLGVCGVTLLVLVLHMVQEERQRRQMHEVIRKLNGKEED